MRDEVVHPEARNIQLLMEEENKRSFAMYHHLIELGTPRELARSVLPCGTYSRMVATVSLHNLLRFLKLRLHQHAQYEIRVYAEAMLQLIEPIVPLSVKAFKELP